MSVANSQVQRLNIDVGQQEFAPQANQLVDFVDYTIQLATPEGTVSLISAPDSALEGQTVTLTGDATNTMSTDAEFLVRVIDLDTGTSVDAQTLGVISANFVLSWQFDLTMPAKTWNLSIELAFTGLA